MQLTFHRICLWSNFWPKINFNRFLTKIVPFTDFWSNYILIDFFFFRLELILLAMWSNSIPGKFSHEIESDWFLNIKLHFDRFLITITSGDCIFTKIHSDSVFRLYFSSVRFFYRNPFLQIFVKIIFFSTEFLVRIDLIVDFRAQNWLRILTRIRFRVIFNRNVL